MLQARIEELGSAILNFTGNIVYIDGFYNNERLMDYLNGINCIMSLGLYDYRELDYSRIRDNCLMIIKQDDKEVKRYQYKPIFRGTVKYKTLEKKTMSKIFTLRKCFFTEQYNVIYLDENYEKLSILYNDIDDVESSFKKMFANYKIYGLDNKVIKEGFDYVRGYDTGLRLFRD